MTGFGKTEMQDDEFILSMELRSINSRFLDFSSRMPRVLLPFEDQAIKLIKEKLIRGRITLAVKIDYMPFYGETTILDQHKLLLYHQLLDSMD